MRRLSHSGSILVCAALSVLGGCGDDLGEERATDPRVADFDARDRPTAVPEELRPADDLPPVYSPGAEFFAQTDPETSQKLAEEAYHLFEVDEDPEDIDPEAEFNRLQRAATLVERVKARFPQSQKTFDLLDIEEAPTCGPCGHGHCDDELDLYLEPPR